jgi:hypothetical protein
MNAALKRWLSFLSFGAQQVVFVSLLFCYPLLMYVSIWVVRVPVVIIWALGFVVPLIYVRPISVSDFLKNHAKSGWLFVAAGLVWIASYNFFCARDGTPVSYEAMKSRYEAPVRK